MSSSAARILAARSLSRAWAKAAAPHARTLSSLASDGGFRSGGGDGSSHGGHGTSTLASLLAIGSGAVVASSFSTSGAAQCEAPEPTAFNVTRTATFKQADSSYAKKKRVGDAIPLVPTRSREVPGPRGIPSRAEQVRKLQTQGPADNPYDVLVIGGGATGTGIALDAATRTNAAGQCKVRVACIERGDFASETSSRSTKLIWAGIKYLASAAAAFISWGLFHSPIKTCKDFYGEFKMVFQCHQERKYMLDKQRHLTKWVPIACPFTEWNIWPPHFGHWLFSFFPILAPPVFKFYDSLSQFSCPPSFIMGKKEARKKFPQLNEHDIKYCAVFYEGQHNDARTNLAIAMTAAEKGADIANYVEMTQGIFDKDGKVIGVKAVDRITGDAFEIYAKNVIFAGGPFTDALRQKESQDEAPVKPAVQGASGSHIVLPGYYAPDDMGLLDYNTSDGRFLFFLPWQGSVLVGTTDNKCDAETLPYPPEEEIQWMLKECEKYLTKDIKVRRSDVLSSWRGWRPLAADPHAPPGGQVSRDHVISKNPDSGVTFIAGGKWTTWREMAEDVLDKTWGAGHPKCHTLDILLHGGEGYSESLSIQLIQKYGIMEDVAEHLVKTYGGRSWEVLEHCKPTGKQWPRYGIPLSTNYPYIEAEVRFACKEYACTIEDVLSRRTRLAFLNSEAAMEALPRVAEIMAEELGWSAKVKATQTQAAKDYLESYGGRIPIDDDIAVRLPTLAEAMDVFREFDTDGSGFVDMQEVKEMAIRLGTPLPENRVKEIFDQMDKNKDGKVQSDEFMAWFNDEATKSGIKKYYHQKTTKIFKEIDTDSSGFIDEQELRDVTVRLGQDFDEKKLKAIFRDMDANKDGKIQLHEFMAWMEKETDDEGLRKMLSTSLGLGGSSWLENRKGGGSFLG